MATITREPGRDRARTRLGIPVSVPPTVAKLDPGEALELDAILLSTRRTWAERQAEAEDALAPEDAPGFADRLRSAFDGDSRTVLADLPEHWRPHAKAGLSAIGEEIAGSARDYEHLARNVGVFNTAKRSIDDMVALLRHDRSAYDRLRDTGLDQLAHVPLSDRARGYLNRYFATELDRALAAAHIDGDPLSARAALLAGETAAEREAVPYASLTLEERDRLAVQAVVIDARRKIVEQHRERLRLETAIDEGQAGRADVEASGLPNIDRRQLHSRISEQLEEKRATAAAMRRLTDGSAWNPDDPAHQADVERAWVAFGGNPEGLARREWRPTRAFHHVVHLTGMAPASATRVLLDMAASDLPHQRQFAEELLAVLPPDIGREDPEGYTEQQLIDAARIIEDFKLTDSQLQAISQETTVAEFVAWLHILRNLNSGDVTSPDARLRVLRDIFRVFAGRDATMGVLLDRYHRVAGGNPDTRGHPAMFPPDFVIRNNANLDFRQELLGQFVDLLPAIGDAKSAQRAIELWGRFQQALDGEGDTVEEAAWAFFFHLFDLVPVAKIAKFSRRVVKIIDGSPVPRALKKKARRAVENRGLNSEKALAAKKKSVEGADYYYGGHDRHNQAYDKDFPRRPGETRYRNVKVESPAGKAEMDVTIFAGKEPKTFAEIKAGKQTSRGKIRRNSGRAFNRRPKQDKVLRDVGEGKAVWGETRLPHIVKGKPVPPLAVQYHVTPPIIRKIPWVWLSRTRQKSIARSRDKKD